MTDVERQWRLHLENRLEELRAKYGSDIETLPVPAWLDSLEGALQRPAVDHPQPDAPVRRQSLADSRVGVDRGASSMVNGGPVEHGTPLANFEDLDV